jgi:hypothetical protein
MSVRIIAGTSKTLTLTVYASDGTTTVDITTGHTIDLHYVRADDPDTVVINKGTALSGDDDIDVATSGASGIASATLVEADTSSLAVGTYKGQWRVDDGTDVTLVAAPDLIISDTYH